MFLSEHWLTSHEVSVFSKDKDNYMWKNMKSSIDPESVIIGRPHGGIGCIGNRVNGIVYKSVWVDIDRICGVQVISNGKLILQLLQCPCICVKIL